MSSAVSAGALTIPAASLPTVTVLDSLAANNPLAPTDGALKVTGSPASAVVTGQPSLLVNATCRFVAKTLPSAVLCGVPPTRVNVFGGFDAGQLAAPGALGGPVSPPEGIAPHAGAEITAHIPATSAAAPRAIPLIGAPPPRYRPRCARRASAPVGAGWR